MLSGVKVCRRVALVFTILAVTFLALSVLGWGRFRDDRVGSMELGRGRVVISTRAGLIAGSAIEPDQVLVAWRAEWSLDATSAPYSWTDIFTNFQTDGEQSECDGHALPLGLPVLTGGLVTGVLYVWRPRKALSAQLG